MRFATYFSLLLLPIAGLIPGWAGGLILLGASPALDLALRLSGRERRELRGPRPHALDIPDWAFPAFTVMFTVFLLRFCLQASSLPAFTLAGACLSWAVIGGISGLIVGHALIHSPKSAARKIGQALFVVLGYPHFPLQHLQMHHRHAASARDLHSAAMGVSYYRFLGRGARGEVRLAWARLRARDPRALYPVLALLALLAGIRLAGGPFAVAAFLTVAAGARSVIWLVNYVQHYGLEGEPHSWDVGFRSTNMLFFNAGLHAHHHERASLSPAKLELRSPRVFPLNFPGILIAALVPSFFRAQMHPLLQTRSVRSGSRRQARRHG